MSPARPWHAVLPPGTMPTAAQLGTAVRLMKRPGWWGTLLVIIVVSFGFVQLGQWQHHRYEAKRDRNAVIEANYDAPVQPLNALLVSPEVTPSSAVIWRPIMVEGTYRTDQILVRNRSLNDQAGFEILAPLVLDDGSVFIVDRGWQATGNRGETPAQILAPPAGRVVVTARLRPSEAPITRPSPAGEIQRIDLATLYQTWGVRPGTGWQAYGVAAQETPAAAESPRHQPRPSEDLGPHLGYAWQWWMFAAAAYSLFGYYLLREAKVVSAAPSTVGEASSARRRPTRTQSRRQADEDWEDSLVDSGVAVRVSNRVPEVRPDSGSVPAKRTDPGA